MLIKFNYTCLIDTDVWSICEQFNSTFEHISTLQHAKATKRLTLSERGNLCGR